MRGHPRASAAQDTRAIHTRQVATHRRGGLEQLTSNLLESYLYYPTKDVLEIITVFSARLYGSRSRKNQKLLDGIQQDVDAAGKA